MNPIHDIQETPLEGIDKNSANTASPKKLSEMKRELVTLGIAFLIFLAVIVSGLIFSSVYEHKELQNFAAIVKGVNENSQHSYTVIGDYKGQSSILIKDSNNKNADEVMKCEVGKSGKQAFVLCDNKSIAIIDLPFPNNRQ